MDKFYYVYYYDPFEGGIIVKAKTVKEARKIGYKLYPVECEYIHIKAKLLENVDKNFIEKYKQPDGTYIPPSCEKCFSYFLNENEVLNHKCNGG